MKSYLDIVRRVLAVGERKENRTGVAAITVAGAMFEHDMADGFPLLTTKRVPFKTMSVELEFFIKGLTDKKWLQERGCHIWDQWCNPDRVPYSHGEAQRAEMFAERDLGPIYGAQWRRFDGHHRGGNHTDDGWSEGVDQLANLVETLKTNPGDRRMIVSAWNPAQLSMMALPPCHLLFQVTVVNGKLNLMWYQRSVDLMLGLPFNIASYGLLLHLLAKQADLEEGRLIGFLADTHIYENHVEGAREQLQRVARALPVVSTAMGGDGVFGWQHTDTTVICYDPHPKIHFPIAI